MTICPFPSYDIAQLLAHGYGQSFEYSKGVMDNMEVRGWMGNNSNSVDNVTESISILKSEQDCPYTRALMVKDGKEKFVPISFSLTRLFHPNGRCCKAKIPQEAANATVGGITFKVLMKDKLEKVEGFQIFLSNQESANDFHRDQFNIEGVELKASILELGYSLYSMKIYETVYLENNQQFVCKNYQKPHEYDRCLNKVYLKQNLHLLNCTPPWLSDKSEYWCRGHLNMDEAVEKKFDFFLSSIINDRADKEECLPPCRSSWYKITKRALDSRHDR